MDIFQHFACYTKLPVRINQVRDHVLEQSGVSQIVFHAAHLDPAHIQGFLHFFMEGNEQIAHVIYARDLAPEWRRIVCCKELIHILDDDESTAKSKNAVVALINQIAMPLFLQAALTRSGFSDYIGELLALCILLPRDAQSLLKPKYDAGDISSDEIAALAQIPEPYVRLVMSDNWTEILDGID